MMKFFRKYTKQLLAVFMALLLIVWLGGSALTNYLRPGIQGLDEVQGKMFGDEVVYGDMKPVFDNLLTLELVGLDWKYPWAYALIYANVGTSRSLQYFAPQVRTEPLTEREWFMLLKEAEKNGVFVPREAAENFKNALPPQRLKLLRREMSLDQMNQAILSFHRVIEAAVIPCQAVQPSEADVQQFIRNTSEKLKIKAVVLDSSKFIDKDYQPADNALIEQFDRYKDVAPRPAGDSEFGYQKPEAVQLEYIKVDATQLVDLQSVSDEAAYTYWEQHKDDFRRPATRPADSSRRAPRLGEVYPTFTEAKVFVREKLLKDAADKEAVRIARELIGQLRDPWKDAPATQPEGYKEPPADATGVKLYPSLVERMESRYPNTLEHAQLDLMDKTALAQNRQIAGASVMTGPRERLTMPDAAFFVPGLSAKLNDAPKEDARYFRNVFETCVEPFIDQHGNAYVFRTIAARPAQAPESWETVREQLAEDLRIIRAHETAAEQARTLMTQAQAVGIETAFKADQELSEKLGKTGLQKPAAFARLNVYARPGMPPFVYPGQVPIRGASGDPELMDACFSLAEARTATQPTPLLLHEAERQRSWILVEFEGVENVTEQEFQDQRETAVTYCRQQRQIELLTNWFNADQIRTRVQWVEPPKPEMPEKAEGDESEIPADTASSS